MNSLSRYQPLALSQSERRKNRIKDGGVISLTPRTRSRGRNPVVFRLSAEIIIYDPL
jgi:hypothetical protein